MAVGRLAGRSEEPGKTVPPEAERRGGAATPPPAQVAGLPPTHWAFLQWGARGHWPVFKSVNSSLRLFGKVCEVPCTVLDGPQQGKPSPCSLAPRPNRDNVGTSRAECYGGHNWARGGGEATLLE